MKYHKLKNFFIATATAALYYEYIAPDAPVLNEILAVLYVFSMMMFFLGEADQSFTKRRKERREKKLCEEKTKSA